MILAVTPPAGRASPHFYHLWLRRITGITDRAGEHCIGCLQCTRDPRLSAKTRGVTRLDLPPLQGFLGAEPGSPVHYVCGVSPKGWATNLHLALVDAPLSAEVEEVGWDGTRVLVRGARRVLIPEVPDGWEGRALAQTRCRNWRFAQGWFRTSDYPSVLSPASSEPASTVSST